jgi:3-isopropylmalate dehydrogenase
VFANLRPVKVHPALIDSSPLKPEKLQGVDILVIRELTGGLYFGWPKGRDVKDGRERAVDTLEYYDYEIRRVMELAFAWPRAASARSRPSTRPTCWNPRGCGDRLPCRSARRTRIVELEHVLVDTAAMRLITGPAGMDVVVTENMFGDILTDEASVLAGSMGMLPSASLGEGRVGLYEPIHGSAPDIAGQGIANPIGMILSTAMLLRHSWAWRRKPPPSNGRSTKPSPPGRAPPTSAGN